MYEGTGALKLSEYKQFEEEGNIQYNDDGCVDILQDDEYMAMYREAFNEESNQGDIHKEN